MSDDTVSTVDAGPRKISRRAVVNAPAAELFAIVADPRRHGELDGSGTVGATTRSPDQMGEGEKFSVKMKMYGLPYTITSKVTEYDQNRVFEWQHPFGHRWRYELDETTPGRTQVTETWDYSTSKFGPVVKMFTGQNSAGIEQTLSRLVQRYQA